MLAPHADKRESLVDVLWRPGVILAFKIQKDKRFDKTKICQVAKNVLFNQLGVTVPAAHVFAWLGTRYGIGAS